MLALPNDPVLLLSVVNTKLRDCYATLNSLCEDMAVNREELLLKLSEIDYVYDPSTNQFI